VAYFENILKKDQKALDKRRHAPKINNRSSKGQDQTPGAAPVHLRGTS
jgi:hypothetical protein